MFDYAKKEQKKTSKPPIQKKDNRTGIPSAMKTRFENLSGFSFDDVRVQYCSSKPEQLLASAYTQGSNIYIAPSQEKYLEHELGHVIQQKQNRVQANITYRGFELNNDDSFEREADRFAERARGASADANGLEAIAPSFGTSMLQKVIQPARWKWHQQSKKWVFLEGYAAAPPKHAGKTDGEIYDDLIPLSVTGVGIKKPAPPFSFLTAFTDNAQEYGELMEVLRDIRDSGIPLDKKQEAQLNTWFSNAKVFLDILKGFRTNPPTLTSEWEEALIAFEEEAGSSVFTRDIDEGELKGQPVSGGTMSVVERMARGFGRIRNYKDLNRGGGAGTYVRFIAERKQPSAQASNSLNAGSIASLGITVLYDAVSIVRDNIHPAHIAFNKQDSAGRIFGTMADSPENLRVKRRESEQVLSKANPNPMRPVRSKAQQAVPDLTPDYIMHNALQGLTEMTRQARGQMPEEEYNEAILFSGAKLGSIKAVLIHKPSVSKGRPPENIVFSDAQRMRQLRRATRKRQQKDEKLRSIIEDIDSIDREVQSILGKREIERLKQLEAEKSILIEEHNCCTLERIPQVRNSRFVNRKEVSTSTAVRSKLTWEDHNVPDNLKKWLDQNGYGGVPMKYLFTHVNPANVRREQLPELAQAIWTRGKAAWENDCERERKLKEMEANSKADVSALRVTGARLSVSKHPIVVREMEEVSLLPEMRINNCLINALSQAGLGRLPIDEEIFTIRTQLLAMGYQHGEMLFASERVLRVIVNALGLDNRRIYVRYLMIGDDHFFMTNPAENPIIIRHRNNHFSAV